MPKAVVTNRDDILEWREKFSDLVNCMQDMGVRKSEISYLVGLWAEELVEHD
jgi:hypothetical protein